MHQQLVPPEILQKADKILFVTHLALGDFTYLQNDLKAFAEQYPHIKIHIWVDEVRRTRCFWRWKNLQKYALYDWLNNCPFVAKVYHQTYSPALLKASIKTARQEQYPVVVSIATLRPHQYARLARKITPQGFVAGMRNSIKFFNIFQRLAYRKLDVSLNPRLYSAPGRHISEMYALWFYDLFGLEISEQQRFPFINIPSRWVSFAKLRFLKWGIDKQSKRWGRVIFINPYAKTEKRSWSLENVVELIHSIKRTDEWGDVSFIVNVVPEAWNNAHKFFDKNSTTNVFLFSADHNFFQLPAIIQLCDLVISVETSIMHFANALHVPVIALMRKKNPEWVPIDAKNSTVITAQHRKEWVNDIPVQRVIEVLNVIHRG